MPTRPIMICAGLVIFCCGMWVLRGFFVADPATDVCTSRKRADGDAEDRLCAGKPREAVARDSSADSRHSTEPNSADTHQPRPLSRSIAEPKHSAHRMPDKQANDMPLTPQEPSAGGGPVYTAMRATLSDQGVEPSEAMADWLASQPERKRKQFLEALGHLGASLPRIHSQRKSMQVSLAAERDPDESPDDEPTIVTDDRSWTAIGNEAISVSESDMVLGNGTLVTHRSGSLSIEGDKATVNSTSNDVAVAVSGGATIRLGDHQLAQGVNVYATELGSNSLFAIGDSIKLSTEERDR